MNVEKAKEEKLELENDLKYNRNYYSKEKIKELEDKIKSLQAIVDDERMIRKRDDSKNKKSDFNFGDVKRKTWNDNN